MHLRTLIVTSTIVSLLFGSLACSHEENSVFYDFVIPWDDAEPGILDMAPMILDAPAGKHGRVVARKDKLSFEDGAPVRLWGVGLTFSTSSPTKFPPDEETSIKLVRRLAKYGFNHVRFVGFDSALPDVYKAWRETGKFGNSTLDRFDFFVSELRKAGIYYSISINNSLSAVLSHYPDIPTTTHKKDFFRYKHLRLYNEKAIAKQKEWYQLFFTHVNPYTGHTLASDPANVYVTAVNEDSMSEAYFHRDTSLGEEAQKSLEALFNKYLSERYASNTELSKAWSSGGRRGLLASENILDKNVALLPATDLMRCNDGRIRDTVKFLAWVDASFSESIKTVLQTAGYKGLFTFTNDWNGYGALYANHKTGDFIDMHGYFDHPKQTSDEVPLESVAQRSFLQLFEDIDKKFPRDYYNAFRSIFVSLLEDRPMILSEWNHVAWSKYSYEGPLMLQAYAAFQGIPVVDGHTYFTHPDPAPRMEYVGNSFAIGANPLWMALYPSLSLAYVKGYIQEPENALCWSEASSEDEYWLKTASVGLDKININSMVPVTAGFRYKLRKQLYGDSLCKPGDMKPHNMKQRNFTQTNEIGWQTLKGKGVAFTVNTNKYQAVAGTMKGESIQLKNLTVTIGDHGAVTAVALDDLALQSSRRILVTSVSEFDNTGSRRTSQDGRDVIRGAGHGPTRLRSVQGSVTLRTKNSGQLFVYAIWPGSKFESVAEVQIKRVGDYTEVTIPLNIRKTPWYVVSFDSLQ